MKEFNLQEQQTHKDDTETVKFWAIYRDLVWAHIWEIIARVSN